MPAPGSVAEYRAFWAWIRVCLSAFQKNLTSDNFNSWRERGIRAFAGQYGLSHVINTFFIEQSYPKLEISQVISAQMSSMRDVRKTIFSVTLKAATSQSY